MRISSIKPDVIALRELYKEEASSLHIPSIQRQFVWDSEDVKELIDSIVNGYPIWKGGHWFKRKYLLTMDLDRDSFESCQDSRDWMHLGHYTM